MNTKPLFELPDEVEQPSAPRTIYALQLIDGENVLYFKSRRNLWYTRDFVEAHQRPNRYESLRSARNARARIARQLKPEWRDKLKVVEYPR